MSDVGEQLALLDELGRALLRAPDLAGTVETVLEVAGRIAPCRSRALFLSSKGQLLPASGHSPDERRLRDAHLLQLAEPIAEEALATARVQHATGLAPADSRIFPGEPCCLAFPLAGEGVLYLGHTDDGLFNASSLELLELLADQAGMALQGARRFEEQSRELSRCSAENQQLKVWLDGFSGLLVATRRLSGVLEVEAVLRELAPGLETLVPHDLHCLMVEEPPCRVANLEDPAGLQAMERAAAVVLENARPLLIEELATSPILSLPQMGSLLATPVLGTPRGAVVLAAAEPGRFDRRDLDILTVLANHLAGALENARLHGELKQAYRLLQESEAQLVQSSKLAAVGQLAAGVAHELNSPLGAISLGLDYVGRNLTRKPDAAARKLETMARSVDKARTIVAKLLYYSRDARLEKQPFDLNQVVRDTLEMLEFHLDRSAIDTDLGELPPVTGNQNEIHQVVTNLVLNAGDAVAGHQAPLIAIRTRLAGERALLEVEDNGPGLAPELLDRIFEPFFTTKPVGKGTGLGLSVSRQIVERHGGELVAEQASGGGALFRLSLPAGQARPS